MALADEVDIHEYAGFPPSVASKFKPRLPSAERKLRSEITSRGYDAVAADQDHPARDAVVEAEVLLTVYYGLPFANLKLDEGGHAVRAEGWDQSRRETMSHSELGAYRDDLWEQAMAIADDVLELLQERHEAADRTDVEENVVWYI